MSIWYTNSRFQSICSRIHFKYHQQALLFLFGQWYIVVCLKWWVFYNALLYWYIQFVEKYCTYEIPLGSFLIIGVNLFWKEKNVKKCTVKLVNEGNFESLCTVSCDLLIKCWFPKLVMSVSTPDSRVCKSHKMLMHMGNTN